MSDIQLTTRQSRELEHVKRARLHLCIQGWIMYVGFYIVGIYIALLSGWWLAAAIIAFVATYVGMRIHEDNRTMRQHLEWVERRFTWQGPQGFSAKAKENQ